MARNPDNLIEQNYVDTVKDIVIEDVPDFLFEDFDPNDSKQVVKYFYRIEKVVRNSFEYKQFIRFLKEYGDMNECSFMKYVTGAESYDIRIEIHHEPITLYDIVVAVYNRRAANGESIHEDMVAKEVMYNHYRLYCGLIPLSETVHEMYHQNEDMVFPAQMCFGYWVELIQKYNKGITPKIAQKIIDYLDRSIHDSDGMNANIINELLGLRNYVEGWSRFNEYGDIYRINNNGYIGYNYNQYNYNYSYLEG